MFKSTSKPTFISLSLLIFALFLSGCWESETRNFSKSDNKVESYSPNASASVETENTNSTNDKMIASNADASADNSLKNAGNEGFFANTPQNFSKPTDSVGSKMLKEYGAVFVAKNGAVPPSKVVFNDESEVAAWQNSVPKSSENIGGVTIELQTPAMNALKAAINEAKQKSQTITPNGNDSAKRNYSGTVTNWQSRVNPGLAHWVGKGKISQAEADKIKALPIPAQIAAIFDLENQGIFFAKSLDKSIIYSVAPPGTSQHISMLALDVKEHNNGAARQILANHGWFQTVFSDQPHFTYLGAKEADLPNLGLKKVNDGGRVYWMPDV